MAMASAQITIVDFNDINIATLAPVTPVLDQLWFDISVSPPSLKRWSGSQWISSNLTPEEYNELLSISTDTTNFRNISPPTNIPTFGAMTADAIFTTSVDGSVVVKFQINYTQATGAGLPADFIFVYVKEGGGTVTSADICYTTSAISGLFELKIKPTTVYSFGLMAARTTASTTVGTNITQSGNVTSPSGNYTGAINGVSAITLTDNANSAILGKTNPFFEDGKNLWDFSNGGSNVTIVSSGLLGGKSLRFAGAGGSVRSSQFIPIDTSRTYKGRIRVRQTANVSGTALIYAGVACYDANYNWLPDRPSSYNYFTVSQLTVPTGTSWSLYEGTITGDESTFTTYNKFRTGTAYIKVLLLPNYGSTNIGDIQEIDSMEFFDITESVWTNIPNRPTDVQLLNSQQEWSQVQNTSGTRPDNNATKNTAGQGTLAQRPTTANSRPGDTFRVTGDPTLAENGKLYIFTSSNIWVSAADSTQVIIDSGVATGGRFEVGQAGYGSQNAGISGSGTLSSDIRFWAGSNFNNAPTQAKFKVTQDGTLTATGANITGSVTIGNVGTGYALPDDPAKILNSYISVGGRNLLLNSGGDFTSVNEFVSVNFASVGAAYFGQQVTVSFDIKSSIPGIVKIYQLGIYVICTIFTIDCTTSWSRHSYTGIITGRTPDGNNPLLSFYGTYGTGIIPTVRNVKIESGNIATDWTAAPEDIQAQFSVITSDFVLSKGEKPAVIADWDAINGDGLTTGTYLRATSAATQLGLTFASLTLAKANLITYLNTIAYNNTNTDTTLLAGEGKTGPELFRSKWTAYYDAEEALRKNITDKAATTANWSGIPAGSGKPADNATKNTGYSQDLMPASGVTGDTWFCTATDKIANPNAGGMFIYDGLGWKPAADRTLTTINNGIVTSGIITVGSNNINAGISGNGNSGDDIRFWAGSTWANRTNAPFRVNEAGVLTATGANISGTITVTGSRSLTPTDFWETSTRPNEFWDGNEDPTGSSIFTPGIDQSGKTSQLLLMTSGTYGGRSGGWGAGIVKGVDPTKTYMYCVPVKIINYGATPGNHYLGISDDVCNLNTTTPIGNPYFATFQRGLAGNTQWYLMVGYVYPYGKTGHNHNTAGTYDMSTGLKVFGGTNFNWKQTITGGAKHRAYQYYCGVGSTSYFGKPLVYLCDGSEPTIQSLMSTQNLLNTNQRIGDLKDANGASLTTITPYGIYTGILTANNYILGDGVACGKIETYNFDGKASGIRIQDGNTKTDPTITIKGGTLTANNYILGDGTKYGRIETYDYDNRTAGIRIEDKADNPTITVKGGTITGGVIQTAMSGKKFEMNGTDNTFIAHGDQGDGTIVPLIVFDNDVVDTAWISNPIIDIVHSGPRTGLHIKTGRSTISTGVPLWVEVNGTLSSYAAVFSNKNDGPISAGVLGESNTTADGGFGVMGSGKVGVWGGGYDVGVWGSNNRSGAVGLRGQNQCTTGTGQGVQGESWSRTGYDFYATGAGINGPFTGSHDALIIKGTSYTTGDIVRDVCIVYHSNISNTISQIELCTAPMDKVIIGVIIGSAELSEEDVPAGLKVRDQNSDIPEYDLLISLYDRAIINSLGEGQINVCKNGGDIEAGDYICSSSRAGKGMKQDDDLLHNYTVAKARENCIWSEGEDDTRMIACTYHCG